MLLAGIIIGGASWAITGVLRYYACALGVLDFPNDRSSHSAPTPRGGGLAIVLVFLSSMIWLATKGLVDRSLMLVLCGGGVLIAAVGFVDDHRHIPAAYRLIVHFAVMIFVVCYLGRLPPINFGFIVIDFGIISMVVTTICLVWFLNLYNFMDGIDGIASIEAICIAGTAALLTLLNGGSGKYIAPYLLLIAAVVGFLIWNWPTARIFMGDTGSGFLGFVLGIFALHSVSLGALPIWSWLILSSYFLVDATVTLFRRWLRGDRLYRPHRNHAYQRLSRFWSSQLLVSLLLLAINVFWLLPLAAASVMFPKAGILLTLIAWIPLVWGVWQIGAGLPWDNMSQPSEL